MSIQLPGTHPYLSYPPESPFRNLTPVGSTSSSSTSRRVLQGALAGGILGGVALVALSIWWFLKHRKPMRRASSMNLVGKERPFYRLEEPNYPIDKPKDAHVKS